ncbi:prepilin-type N-terminal cleavage/methylation domain-containing protein [Candidatus Gottesmanbacteria bacterium]|nr:prepilin-type N-terminal cleavage/methylation domain-containing protein [Candidatus Gottesmanbacteria bacterium]
MNYKRGFTLIELMVVMGAVLLLSGGAITNYNNYSDRQRVNQAMDTLKNDLRTAQNRALVSQKPAGNNPDPGYYACGQLVGYRVTFSNASGTGSYSTQAVCQNSGVEEPKGDITTRTLPTGVLFNPLPLETTFYSLFRGASPSQSITISGANNTQTVSVSASGNIEEPLPTATPTPIGSTGATGPGAATATPTSTPTATPTPIPTTGDGLLGRYFDTKDLVGNSYTRVDATINFDWGGGSPMSGIPNNKFSVRWTGNVRTTVAGNYEFTGDSNDGKKLWVNGVLLINKWQDGNNSKSATITLSADTSYPITLEYYENKNDAHVKLLWKVPGTSGKVIVPQASLYST